MSVAIARFAMGFAADTFAGALFRAGLAAAAFTASLMLALLATQEQALAQALEGGAWCGPMGPGAPGALMLLGHCWPCWASGAAAFGAGAVLGWRPARHA